MQAKTTKELKSEIEKCRSGELAAKANWVLQEGRLKRSGAASKKGELPGPEKTVLGSLDQAFAIDGAIRGKLEQLSKSGKTDAGLQKEIADATNQLEAVMRGRG